MWWQMVVYLLLYLVAIGDASIPSKVISWFRAERDTYSREGCAPPDVVINGTMVPGGAGADFGSVQEVQFLGIIGPMEQKRICKIKCLNGVWVGPLCTIEEDGGRFQPMLRQCQLRPTDVEIVMSFEGKPLALEQEVALPHGSTIQIRCEEVGMYKFTGNSTIKCLNGQWNAAMPQCIATTLQTNFSVESPPTILYNVASGDAGVTELGEVVLIPGSIVHFDCLFQRQNGNPEWTWTPVHRQYPSGWAISLEERSWKYRLSIYYAKEHDSGTYTCTTPKGFSNEIHVIVREVFCPPIQSVDHNRVMAVEGNKMHSKARFACVEGFNLAGAEEIACGASGQWSDEPPKCEVIQCPLLESEDSHLRITPHNRTYGSRAFFSCPTGFRLIGPTVITCLKNQSWSESIPVCEAITCPTPVPPSNGRIIDSGRYLTGDFVQYTCNVGFILIGESIAVCDDEGNWSQQPPTCKPACEFPGEPANGHIVPTKFHYDIGETVSVACNTGFRLLGAVRLHCNPSGHWSNPLPHCRPHLVS